MIKNHTIGVRLGLAAAAMAALLWVGSPEPALAAVGPVILAPTPSPSDCGSYHTAETDPVAALDAAKTGKVLVCPGTYNLSGEITITGANNLTIARAVTTGATFPTFDMATGVTTGMDIAQSSNVIIDGLIFDGSANTQGGYINLEYEQSSGAVRNSSLIQPNTAQTVGLYAFEDASNKPLSMVITNTSVMGAGFAGVLASGPLKLTMTGVVVNAPDGGRITTPGRGLALGAASTTLIPSGRVDRCVFLAGSVPAVQLADVTGFTLSHSLLSSQTNSDLTVSAGEHNAAGIKIVGNTFTLGMSNPAIRVTDSSATFKISGMSITGNLITAGQHGTAQPALAVTSSATQASSVMVSLSGNTLAGFLTAVTVTGLADVTAGHNTILP